MWRRNPRWLAFLVVALVGSCPTLTLAKGGGGGGHGGGGGGHSSGSGHAAGGHFGGHGSGGHLSTWSSSSGGHHHSNGYGFGNPAGGYTASITINPTWNYYLPLLPTPNDSAPSDPDLLPFGPPPSAGTPESAAEFIEKGERAFKAGDYDAAVHEWRHAALDDPQNGVLMMKLGQALFATGQYHEAVFTIQVGMYRLPTAEWGDVVSHYSKLYGNPRDYTNQLRALEEAIRMHDDDPALRFVAGFEFGYLGFVEQSLVHLDEAMMYESDDEMTDLLTNEMRLRLAKAAPPHVVQVHAHHTTRHACLWWH
jgi:hypothetical protein